MRRRGAVHAVPVRRCGAEHGVGEVLCGRVIEVLGEVEERGVRGRSQRRLVAEPAARSMSSAGDSRDFAVPTGHDSASAVSLSLRPAK